ncbi:MAG: response regulator [Planctomycetales bacterium]|nr:response regulator [Planctomycetales bacterium]
MSSEKQQVLIAEDNPGLARVLSFKFKSCGFEPITCANGGEAWKSFCDSQVVAVVSDHEMPIMSGIELIQRVREMDSKIPCFLVTGRQLELARDPRVLKLNISEVFGKPFSPGTVVSAVTDAINKTAPASPILPVGSITNAFSGSQPRGITGAGA